MIKKFSKSDRGPIKSAHEMAYIENFLNWHARVYRSQYSIVSRPDPIHQSPPDAIIKSGRKISWIEVGSAFWDEEWAQHLYSRATPGENHKPMKKGPHCGPDEYFSERFANLFKGKIEKKSYRSIFEKHGAGYLLIPIMYPLFNETTLFYMRKIISEKTFNNKGYFRSVYLAYDHGSRFLRWRWYPVFDHR